MANFGSLYFASLLLVLASAEYQRFAQPVFSYSEPSRPEYYSEENDNLEAFGDEIRGDVSQQTISSAKVIPMTKQINVHAVTLAPLNPEAEMLPASYKGVKPPGVDHMELRLAFSPKEIVHEEPVYKATKVGSNVKFITIGDVLGYPQKLTVLEPENKEEDKRNDYFGYQKKEIAPTERV